MQGSDPSTLTEPRPAAGVRVGARVGLNGRAAPLVVFAFLLILPFYLGEDSAFLDFLVDVLLLATVALGLQLVLGRAGLLAIGQAAFWGLGAYASALLMIELDFPFPLAFIAAIVVAVVGALIMAPIIRLSPIYFAMASFAFGIVVFEGLNQWVGLTGGANGLTGVPPAGIGSLEVLSTTGYYLLSLALLALTYLLLGALSRSPLGQGFSAMRQSEIGARAAGLRVARLKLIALVVAAGVAGAAGSIYASSALTIAPSVFGINQSVALLAMVIVGGKRDPWGALIGAFVVQYLVSYGTGIADYQVLIYGALLTIAMVALPDGISGLLRAGILRLRGFGDGPERSARA